MDITLPDGTVIRDVPEGTTKEELIAKLRANGYDVSQLMQPALHGPELAAQREADALKERMGTYAPADDPLAPKGGGTRRKPDLFDAAMAGQIPNEQPKPLQQDIADRLGAGADFLMEPLKSRNVPANDPVNALTRMAVEPLVRLPEALVRDPLKTVAQDYNPIYQAGMGYKDVESAAGKAMQGDFAEAGPQALEGVTQMMGGALGLVGLKGGPKVPGAATTLAEAERMAAGPRMPPVEASAPAPQAPPAAMTYEEVADLVKTAARGGMGSQQAVEKLARAAPLNREAAAAAERLGIDVPPDVLLDHTQLKEAIGLTRSMPGTLASATWADAVERAATKADEAMAMIDGSPDLSEVSDTVLKSMQDTQRALQAQSDDMYKLINAKISGGPPKGAPGAVRARVIDAPSSPSTVTPMKGVVFENNVARTTGLASVSPDDALRLSRELNIDQAAPIPKPVPGAEKLKETFNSAIHNVDDFAALYPTLQSLDRDTLNYVVGSPSANLSKDGALIYARKRHGGSQGAAIKIDYLQSEYGQNGRHAAQPESSSTVTPIGKGRANSASVSGTLYHGSNGPLENIDRPIFVSPDRNVAQAYADSWYENGKPHTGRQVHALQSSAEKPYDFSSKSLPLKSSTIDNISYDFPEDVETLRKAGFDSVIDPRKPDQVLILDPSKISPAPKPPIVKNGEAAASASPPPTVDLVNSRRLMDGVVRELGGDASKLSSLEKQLMEMSSPGRKTAPTYAALMRMKSDVGQALEKASGPYKDVNSGILKRLYGALSEDQLLNVERIGGKQLRDDLRLANQLTAKRKALEDRIVSLFGDERNGSIAQKLVATVKSGSKGDVTGFNRVVRQLPPDLRKKAVATAIAAAARETKTNGFGFAKYVDLYQGLRRNSEVYKTVVQTLGPDSEKFLNDLYKISKRITEARANVKTTGQANQALVQGMMAEGLVQQVMKSTAGRQATMGGATVLGGALAGPAAGAASAMLVNTLSKASKNTINAAGDLFASPEWQQLVAQVAAENRVNKKLFNIARTSKAFRTWAKTAGITDPDAWLRNALASSIGTGIAANAGQARAAQPYEETYEQQAAQ